MGLEVSPKKPPVIAGGPAKPQQQRALNGFEPKSLTKTHVDPIDRALLGIILPLRAAEIQPVISGVNAPAP
jgi:hypothetical protein